MAKTKYRDEDLFKDSTMTFGEHLEELRVCLFKAIVALVAALVIVLWRGWPNDAILLIQEPLKVALEKYYLKNAREKAQQRLAAMADSAAAKGKDQGAEGVALARLAPLIERRFVPSYIRVDPGQLASELRRTHPQLAEQLQALSYAPSQFLDAPGFCRQVYEGRQTAGDLAAYLWEKLPPESQQLVELGASLGPAEANATAPADLSVDQKTQLSRDLAKVLASPTFHVANERYLRDALTVRPSWLAETFDITGSAAEQKARAERVEKLLNTLQDGTAMAADKDAYRDINFLLLAMAYPKTISVGPSYEDMIEITTFQPIQDDPRINPRSLNPQEMFMIFLKAALVVSLIVASPFVFYFLWTFVAAGLYPHEKRYIYIYLPFSLCLFWSGVILCYNWVFQYVLDFLFLFNSWMKIDPDVRISEWFGFALLLPIGFGIAFQLPLVMLFLERFGMMSVQKYLSYWRVSVLVIVILSGLLTPADPYSILLMAVPLVVLYFLGILLCKFMPRHRSQFEEEAAE